MLKVLWSPYSAYVKQALQFVTFYCQRRGWETLESSLCVCTAPVGYRQSFQNKSCRSAVILVKYGFDSNKGRWK